MTDREAQEFMRECDRDEARAEERAARRAGRPSPFATVHRGAFPKTGATRRNAEQPGRQSTPEVDAGEVL